MGPCCVRPVSRETSMVESASHKESGREDVVSGFALTILGAGVGWMAAGFPSLPEGHPGPGLFPGLIAAGLVASGLVILTRGVRRRHTEVASRKASGSGRRGIRALRLVATLATVALYPWLQSFVGFVISIILVALSVGLLLGARPVRAAATAAVAAVSIYWLFTGLLGVPL